MSMIDILKKQVRISIYHSIKLKLYRLRKHRNLGNMKAIRLITLLIFCFIFANQAYAKPIYVYKTNNGIIKFSNSKPKNTKFEIFSKYSGKKINTFSKIKSSSNYNNRSYDYLIRKAAIKYNLSKSLVKAVIHAESNFKRTARSNKGALGLMQLMPVNLKTYKVKNPYDAKENIFAGTAYLSKLHKTFSGDLELTLAAYNAGIGNVRKYKGLPPFKETKNYVKKVKRLYQNYLRA